VKVHSSRTGGAPLRPYRRLPVLIVGITVLAVGIGAAVLSFLERRLVASTGESLALVAAGIAEQLDQVLFERYGDVRVTAATLAPQQADPAALTRRLNRMKEEYLVYRWLGVADSTGRLVAATNPGDVGEDRSGEGWFKAVRDRKAAHVQDVSIDDRADERRQGVVFAAPIVNDRGEWLGVFAARVGLSELEEIVGRPVQVFEAQRPEAGKIEWQLLHHSGTVIADSSLREEGRINLKELGLPSARLSLTNGRGYVEEQHVRRRRSVVTGYAGTEGYGDFPGLQWGVLVRMDRHDIVAPTHAFLWKVGGAGAALWAPLLGLLFWMTGKLRREHALAHERGDTLSAILTSIGDAVIVTDERGRVVFMNPIAEGLVGWKQEEARGRDLADVFVIVNEATRAAVESPVARVLREGAVVGLANHTILIARDGAERPIDDSGAPVRDEGGRLEGVVLVFRDVTERKRAEAALLNRTQSFRALVEVSRRIAATWELPQLLRFIVESAVDLTAARYGAIGVFDEKSEGQTEFITVGIDEATRAAIGAPPTGRGLLGHVGTEQGVLRLKDLTRHPAFTGFPPHHPRMRSFLGVPIRAHGRLVGRLYLGEKRAGDEFTEVDAEIVGALAIQAGSAIEEGRLFAQIAESEQRLSALSQALPDAVIVVDQRGRIHSWNNAAKRMFGFEEREAMGQPFTLLMPPDDHEAHRKRIEQVGASDEIGFIGQAVEGQGRRKDGTVFPLQSALAAWREGKKVFFTCILRDVTERKRAERRVGVQYAVTRVLAAAPSLHEAGMRILQAIGERLEWDVGVFWSVDRHADVLRCADVWRRSSAAADEFERVVRSRTFPPGEGLPGRVWAGEEAAWVADVAGHPDDPRAASATRSGLHGGCTFPIRLGKATLGVLEFFSRDVQPPDEPLLETLAAVGSQIGQFVERKRAEEDLRHRLQLEKLIGTVSADFVSFPAGEVTSGITGALRLIGEFLGVDRSYVCVRADGEGKARSEAVYEWCAEGVETRRDHLQRFFVDVGRRWIEKLERSETIEVYSLAELPPEASPERDFLQSQAAMSLLMIPMIAEQTFVGFVGFESVRAHRVWSHDDITQLRMIGEIFANAVNRKRADDVLRQTEEQLRHAQKLEAIGRLAGGVAHDFNNLLTVMHGYSALLLERLGPDDALRRYSLEIRAASERAAALTRQLLAFSRRQALALRAIDLNHTVAAMESMLRRLIGEHIELVTVLRGDPWLVSADPGQIEQVIMNLAVNAHDAMPEGGTLTIETATIVLDQTGASRHPEARPGAYVTLAMTDTGHGMDAETKLRIFEPFFTTKEAGKGTGLGLAIVYGIVKQSGGFIDVQSNPGEGATFTLYLPRAEDVPDAPSSEQRSTSRQARGAETILLVEDEDGVRRLALEVLETEGYRVLAARNGADALVLSGHHQGPIHLLVTDVVMPQMSGPMLADRLRARHPEMKLLYMSGYSGDAIALHSVVEHGIALLAKPFSPEGLARTVREVLDASEGSK
jgi:PAS domain S-box-containing protein